MTGFIAFADRLSTFVGKLFAWTIVVLTLVVCYEVAMRYGVGRPTSWAYDTSYMMYGAGFLMAGAYALCRNGHVRADVVYRLWPPRVQAGLDLALYFLFFFPGVLAFIYSGYGFARMSWMFNERSSFSPDGPILYPFKALIPITGVLLLIQGVAEVMRCVLCLREGAWPPRPQDVEELEKQIIDDVQSHHTDALELGGRPPGDEVRLDTDGPGGRR